MIKSEIERRLGLDIEFSTDPDYKERYRDVIEKLSDNKITLQSMYNIVKTNISKEEADILAEEERRKKQCEEINKRRFNYIPFLLEMLSALSKHY